jgi:hypothetical protein
MAEIGLVKLHNHTISAKNPGKVLFRDMLKIRGTSTTDASAGR